jgi:hypothetical protein
LTERALRLFRGEPLAGAELRLGRERTLPTARAAERGLHVDTLNESLWRLAMQAEHTLGLREAVADH